MIQLILLLISVLTVQNYEVFAHKVKAESEFEFRDTIFSVNGFSIIIKAIKLNEKERFKVRYSFKEVDFDNKSLDKKYGELSIFQGNRRNDTFHKGYTGKKDESNKVVLADFIIQNEAKRDIYFEINLNEYLFEKQVAYQFNRDGNESDKSTANVAYEEMLGPFHENYTVNEYAHHINGSHTRDGYVKYQTIEYMRSIIHTMNQLTKQVKKYKHYEQTVDGQQIKQIKGISGGIKMIGFIGIGSILLISILFMCSLRRTMRMKKMI